MNPTALDFRAIQIEMEKFHKRYGCLPNLLIVPVTYSVVTIGEKSVEDMTGCKLIFAACKEPIVGLMVKE